MIASKGIDEDYIATFSFNKLLVQITSEHIHHDIHLMKISAESKEYALKILNIFAIVLWIKVSNMIIAGGILRSGGNTKIILVLEMIGMWCIGVPVGIVVSTYANLQCSLQFIDDLLIFYS